MPNEYTVFYEPGPRIWSAYVSDLPGWIATARTREDLDHRIREAIELHSEGLRRHGDSVPEPTIEAAKVSVGE